MSLIVFYNPLNVTYFARPCEIEYYYRPPLLLELFKFAATLFKIDPAPKRSYEINRLIEMNRFYGLARNRLALGYPASC